MNFIPSVINTPAPAVNIPNPTIKQPCVKTDIARPVSPAKTENKGGKTSDDQRGQRVDINV